MMTWFCVLFGTGLLGAGAYGAMKLFGHLAMQRDDAERARLQEEWKRRAAARRGGHEGALPPGEGPGPGDGA
jgi:hypothetical protein